MKPPSSSNAASVSTEDLVVSRHVLLDDKVLCEFWITGATA